MLKLISVNCVNSVYFNNCPLNLSDLCAEYFDIVLKQDLRTVITSISVFGIVTKRVSNYIRTCSTCGPCLTISDSFYLPVPGHMDSLYWRDILLVDLNLRDKLLVHPQV